MGDLGKMTLMLFILMITIFVEAWVIQAAWDMLVLGLWTDYSISYKEALVVEFMIVMIFHRSFAKLGGNDEETDEQFFKNCARMLLRFFIAMAFTMLVAKILTMI